MRLKLSILAFLVFISFPLYSQSKKSMSLFRIQYSQLSIKEYPWGDELRLEIRGVAAYLLGGTRLNVSLHYGGYKYRQFIIDLEKQKKKRSIKFEKRFEPINNALQKILPGKYTIIVQFLPQGQIPKFFKYWKGKYKNRTIASFRKSFFLGTKENFKKIAQQNKAFHIKNMKALNEVFRKLTLSANQALHIYRDMRFGKRNPFVVRGAFSVRRWYNRVNKPLLQEVTTYKDRIYKQRADVLFPIYPRSSLYMGHYCEILQRLVRLYTKKIMETHKRRALKRYMHPDFGVTNIKDIIRDIQRFHAVCASELKISLRKVLGYLPPPGVLK